MAGLTCAAPISAEADPEIVFGPGPRALDNRSAFAAEYLADWQALAEAGVTALVLNPTFLMETAFQRGPDPDGTYPPRPQGSYLETADIAALGRIVEETGLAIHYEAGIGLSGAACDTGLGSEEAGRLAARTEFDRTLSRLLEAEIPVAALHFDGPFLRLLDDARKRWSCNAAKEGPDGADHAGDAFGVSATVRRARAYMAALRDMAVAARPGEPAPRLHLVVNLPNWQVADIPRDRNEGPPTTDLRAVLAAFAALQAERAMEGDASVTISEIVIDYPLSHVKASRRIFRDRALHLWRASRDLNPGRPRPALGVITNTRSIRHPCLQAMPPNSTPFLPYRRDGRPIDAKCLAAQGGEGDRSDRVMDSDTDYMRESLAYLEDMLPGGRLNRLLVTEDGARIGERLAHLYVQSWGINPVRNIWYARALARWLETGEVP